MISPSVRIIRRKSKRKTDSIRGKSRVKVGYPAAKVTPGVISRAIWNHYGTSRGIPPRPWLHLAMVKNRAEYSHLFKSLGARIITGSMSIETAVRTIGIKAQGDVQKSLIALRLPPNAPSTIRKKGSSNPLIDTGEMNQSTTHQLID